MNADAPRRILVTGASGFIGARFLAARREQRDDLAALVRSARAGARLPSGTQVRTADLSVPASLEGVCAGVDTVVHLASHAETEGRPERDEPDAHQRVTVEGTRRLLAEARRAGVRRFVFMSSVKAMGEGAEECLDETSPPRPVSAYGRAKLAAETLVSEAAADGLETCTLRLPMVYGPNPKGSLMRMIAAIDRGRFPPLPEVGNRRSMVHVDDVVQALSLAVSHEAAAGRLYIVTDGRQYSTREIYDAIRQALGRSALAWSVPRNVLRVAAWTGDAIERLSGKRIGFNGDVLQKLIGSACYDSTKIMQELGFRRARTFEQALPEMINVYRGVS